MTHELSLLSSVLARVEEIARSEGAACVTRVTLRLGALVSCSPDHLREHFVEASRGTVAEGADLIVEVQSDLMAPHSHEVILDTLDIEVES
jgi:hydrogenase nickel incorporation protein HypA/HybF